MANTLFPPGATQQWWVPALARLADLLAELVALTRYSAGDPEQAERAKFFVDAQTVNDTAVVQIETAQDRSRVFSTLLLQFTEASGRGRYDVTGAFPTAAGRGLQIPSGSGTIYIRGSENIRAFRIIAETGQTVLFSAILFQIPAFSTER